MASNKGALGTRKWGPKTPGRRVAGARRCLGPRAVSGGRWRSGERQRGEGGPRRGPPTRQRLQACGGFLRSVCAKLPGASRWPGVFVARIHKPCRELQCTSARGRSVFPKAAFGGPSSAPRPQVSGYLCKRRGLGLAALGGWRTCWSCGRRRHRCFLGHFAEEGSQAGRVCVPASVLWLSGRRRIDGGRGRMPRVQGDCLPFGKGAQPVATTQVGTFLGIKQKNPLPSQRI